MVAAPAANGVMYTSSVLVFTGVILKNLLGLGNGSPKVPGHPCSGRLLKSEAGRNRRWNSGGLGGHGISDDRDPCLPLLGIVCIDLRRSFRRRHYRSQPLEAIAHHGGLNDLVDHGVQSVHDGIRRPGRSRKGVPGLANEPLKPGLSERRYVIECSQSDRGRDPQCSHRAPLHLAHCGQGRIENERQAPRNQIYHGLWAARIGDMDYALCADPPRLRDSLG